MTKNFCDRCKKESIVLYHNSINNIIETIILDLCADCTRSIGKYTKYWLSNLDGIQGEE